MHVGLVGYAEAEQTARTVIYVRRVEEDYDAIAWKYHRMVVFRKLRQAALQETNRQTTGTGEGSPSGGYLHQVRAANCRGSSEEEP